MRERIPDPNDEQTFIRSKVDWQSLEEEQNLEWLHFYRAMFALRKKEIIPLLRCAKTQADFRSYGQSGIAVEWRLGDAVLSLVANLGSTAVAEMPRPCGRAVYGSSSDLSIELDGKKQIAMPAWSVAWFLCPSHSAGNLSTAI
jgi:1,4-alpha-glucan branching enzyme